MSNPKKKDEAPLTATTGEQGHNDNQETPKTDDKASFFDKLRLTQDFATGLGVKKLLTTVPVKKPGAQEWFRIQPEYSLRTLVLELKEERETYLVEQPLWAELNLELKPVALLLGITRTDTLFIWPAKLPNNDGRLDNWSMSALSAVEEAKENWVRLKANMGLGAYDVFVASGDLPAPSWPQMKFEAVLEIAFKDRLIKSMDHPVVRRLRGLP